MPQPERFEVLVLGSGTGGKLIAWHLAQSGHRTAVVEAASRSCPSPWELIRRRPFNAADQRMVARAGKAADFGFLVHSHMMQHSTGYKSPTTGTTRTVLGFTSN